jgi:hypothetical protein
MNHTEEEQHHVVSLKKLTIFWFMPRQQLAQELPVFERGLHAEIIYQEIWKVQGARKVRVH